MSSLDLTDPTKLSVEPGELPPTMAAWVIREERFGEPRDAFQIEEIEVPEPWLVMLDRGPYDLAGELELLAEQAVDVLVTKDSGGTYTWPKMAAAGQLRVPVVVVRRGSARDRVETVPDAAAALAWTVGR